VSARPGRQEPDAPANLKFLHEVGEFRDRQPAALLQWSGGALASQCYALASKHAQVQFPGDILCLLIDLGFNYKEIRVTTVEQRRGKSNALTFRDFLSVTHTLIEIANRRVSNRLYRPR
jgi:hypothetical protein